LEIILKYFKDLSPEQIDRLGALEAIYTDWNAKINVISRKDIDELYLKHVLHSMAIAKVITFKPGTSIIDVGCGGGFPGIPLAILFPEVQFTLVDSIGKKIKVVNEVAAAIGLTNVKGVNERAEKLNQKFDFVISRAVTAFPQFVELSKNLISPKHKNAIPNGILYLKGGDFEEEIAPFRKKVEIFSIQTFFEEDFFETKKLIYLSL
jgi:16S rRNA (guanine527-N7)-methyltransferase